MIKSASKTNIPKIEKYGLQNYVMVLKQKGYSDKDIADKVNQLLDGKDKMTTNTITNYFKINPELAQMSEEDMESYHSLNRMSQLEDKIWELETEAEWLMDKAKNSENHNEMIKSIRICNEVIRTCLAVAKELRDPIKTIHIDVEQRSMSFVTNIINRLPKESQNIVRKEVDAVYEEVMNEDKS